MERWLPSLLLVVALSYFLFVLSLNVFSVGYNYLDYRFSWSPLEISYFFATYNVFMGLAGGLFIRWIVPRYLSEEYGALFGISVQVCRFYRGGGGLVELQTLCITGHNTNRHVVTAVDAVGCCLLTAISLVRRN